MTDESWETHSPLCKPSQRRVTGQHRPCREMSSCHLHAGRKPLGHKAGVLGRGWLQGTKRKKETDRCTVPAVHVTDRQHVPDSRGLEKAAIGQLAHDTDRVVS